MIEVNGLAISQGHFPDKTLKLTLPPYKHFIVIKWLYENDAELFTLICIRKHYKDCSAILEIPYLPHARMDRVQGQTDVFTLKYFCEVINSLNFSRVFTLDVHSNVSLALIDNVTDTSPKDDIKLAIEDINDSNLALFFPDEGAMKRYNKLFCRPYGFGIKNRDWATGKILNYKIEQKENVTGKNVLIIDDICSKGGTFYHAAKALKQAGAKNVYLYVTHLEETYFEGDLYKEMEEGNLVNKIYTANPLFFDNKAPQLIINTNDLRQEEDSEDENDN